MHLILTGATGRVGASVLDAMLRNKEVTKISILSRRPVQMAEDSKDPRVDTIIHKDFEKYDDQLLSRLAGADGCVWALGTSQNNVSKEEYIRITKGFALAAVTGFEKLSSSNSPSRPFRFVFVSGEGATIKPGPTSPLFARVKGETELLLAETHNRLNSSGAASFKLASVRPGWVDYGGHKEIENYVPASSLLLRAAETAGGPLARCLFPSSISPTKPLGDFLVGAAMGKHDSAMTAETPAVDMVGRFPIVNNKALRKIVGL